MWKFSFWQYCNCLTYFILCMKYGSTFSLKRQTRKRALPAQLRVHQHPCYGLQLFQQWHWDLFRGWSCEIKWNRIRSLVCCVKEILQMKITYGGSCNGVTKVNRKTTISFCYQYYFSFSILVWEWSLKFENSSTWLYKC